MGTSVRLRVQPYEWAGGDRDGRFSLRIYTHSPDNPETGTFSERILVRVDDYETFCRMELPSVVEGKKVTWTQEALAAYAAWLRNTLGHHQPTRIEYRELQKTIYYKGGATYPFFTCFFHSEEAMRHCVNLVNKQGYQIEELGFIKSRIWETSISSIHRFITDAYLGYGQWFDVVAQKVPDLDKISRCQHEFVASWKDFKASPEEETGALTVSPIETAVDIEQYSENHRAMPNKDFITDVVFQISVITQRMNRPETRQKDLLVVGPCGEIKGANVYRFRHEIEMIDGMCAMIKERDPSAILGYNIFKYDFPVLDARMKLAWRDWIGCGLIIDQSSSMKLKAPWKSSAYGTVYTASLEAEGRICIDLFTIIRRDHKLDRYTLDHVGKHFLGRGKHDVTAAQMFEIFAECKAAQTEEEKRIAGEKMAKVGAYCLEDSCLCIDLFEAPALTVWVAITELATAATVTPCMTFTQGQQVRIHNRLYQYAYRNGFVIDDREGSRDGFVGGKVQDPIPGRYMYPLIFDFAGMYPSIIRAYNICYTTLVPPESDIPDEKCHIIAWTEDDKYYRYRFIKQEYCVGLLPRICEDLTNRRSAIRKLINPKNDPAINNKYNQQQNGIKVINNSVFGVLGVDEGRMPLKEGARCITAIGRQLIGIAAKYVQEKHKGEIVYGDTDSIMVNLGITDPTKCVPIGEALSKEITALYPRPITLEFERAFAIAFFIKKKMYAGIPLSIIRFEKGDVLEQLPTDNDKENLYKVMMVRNGKTEIKCLSIPKTVSICSDLKGKLTVEIAEKDKDEVIFVGGAVGKRIIAGTPMAENGKPNPKDLVAKGIVLARRDNCLWIREVYKDVLMGIMFGRSLQETTEVIDREILRMMSRQIPFEKMMVTRGVGSNYKPNSNYPLKVFIDQLKLQGQQVQAGERIDYVFVKDREGRELQGMKMRTPEMYWEGCQEEPIDRLHYIEKVMKNSVEQIVYLAYHEEIKESERKYTPNPRRRNKLYTYLCHDYINSWVKVIKEKEKTVEFVKAQRPHFYSQSEALRASFV